MSGLVISKISFISFARLKSQINYIFARVMLLLTLGKKSKQHGQSYSKMFFGRSFNEQGEGDYYKTCAELSMHKENFLSWVLLEPIMQRASHHCTCTTMVM